MRLLRGLRTDIMALLLVCLGLGLLATCFQTVQAKYGPEAVVVFVICCLVVSTAGVLIGVIGRRRERQGRQQQEEDARRGYASKSLMPKGDQMATVIARCAVTLVGLGFSFGTAILLAVSCSLILPGQNAFLFSMGALVVAVGSSIAMGILTWLRLSAQNRRLAEPLCPLCGYVLYGAVGQRCPECGMLFDLDEVNTNLAYLDEQGRLQPKE